jgi:hypothetical protein
MEYLWRKSGQKYKNQSRIMNTIKNIFITYGGYILLMFLGANFMYILLMLLSLSRNDPIPDPEIIYPASCYIQYFILSIPACIAVRELSSIGNYQLPATTLRKYLTALGAAFTLIIISLLFSYVIDGIGAALEYVFSLKTDIHIGRYMNFLCERTGGFSCLFLTIATNAFLATLIRNKSAMYGVVITINLVSGIYAIAPQDYSPILCIMFWILGFALLIASYHIYKHWQIANSGIFMI